MKRIIAAVIFVLLTIFIFLSGGTECSRAKRHIAEYRDANLDKTTPGNKVKFSPVLQVKTIDNIDQQMVSKYGSL